MSVSYKSIDVKKLIEHGKEPLPLIRKMVDELKENEGLEVTAPFLPSPLIEKLKAEGFQCRPEHQPNGAWVTRFWRE